MKQEITIRAAERRDAHIIAEAVAMAIGSEEALRTYCGNDYLAVLTEVARAEQTQYSYRYAFIAQAGDQLIGAIVGYDGAMLGALRAETFDIIERMTGCRPSIPDETEAGEYYLDSLGVRPAYRGKGVGRALIAAFCNNAFMCGYKRVGLIVDTENPTAERLYSSLGFECVGERTFFGHQMRHLQLCSTTAPCPDNTSL